MPTTRMKSGFLALLFGLVGAPLLLHSLAVHPQEKSDQPSATQSKESSSGASSGTSTQQATGAGSSKLSERDEKMMKQIAESHLAEISAAKLAQDKAASDEVKSFAKKLADDHSKGLDDLKQLAQSKGITLPTEPSRQQMAQQKKLQSLSGEKFDRQYMQQAGDHAHKETHRLLQRVSSRAEDTDLKNYASKVIGTIETHQQMAKETTRNLKSTSEGKSSPGTESTGGAGKSSGESSSGAGEPSSDKSGSGQ